MKSRLQRWGNKRAIVACARPLYEWVQKGDKGVRLTCVRELDLDPATSLPAGSLPVKALVMECHALVVEFFLDFASGKVLPKEVNKKGDQILSRQKPYSEGAGKDKDAFKNVSPAWFAISLATLYPFLAEDRKMWKDRLKSSVMYPVTSLWPAKVVKRYVHFANVVFKNIKRVFKNYEDLGGQYFQDDDGEQTPVEEADAQEDSSDCDDVFQFHSLLSLLSTYYTKVLICV